MELWKRTRTRARRLQGPAGLVAFLGFYIGIVILVAGFVSGAEWLYNLPSSPLLHKLFGIIATPAGVVSLIVLSFLAMVAIMLWPHADPPGETVVDGPLITTPPAAEPEPNLQLITIEYRRIGIDDGVASEGGTNLDWNAALAVFRNEAITGKKVGKLRSVHAHLEYTPDDGEKTTHIAGGTWIDSSLNQVSLDVGDTKLLIVAAQASAYITSTILIENTKRYPSSKNLRPVRIGDPDTQGTLKVYLVAGRNGEWVQEYRFAIDAASKQLKVQRLDL